MWAGTVPARARARARAWCLQAERAVLVPLSGLNSREILVYKNCTNNCTFVYAAQMPPAAPKALRTNSFYWWHCCGIMHCNVGGPTNLERDILPDQTFEEELEEEGGAMRLGGGGLWGALLSCASILVGSTLT